jgi:PAS domain S-box-containing protein
MACDFPLVVWSEADAVVRLANEEAADLVGIPLDELIGRQLRELVEPQDAVEATAGALARGTVESVRTERWVRRRGGERVPVSVWTRSVEVDGQRAAITLLVPTAEVPRLGRDPSAPWRDLDPIAIGTADAHSRITSVSADIDHILGAPASEWAGSSFLDLAHPDDRHRVGEASSPRATGTRVEREVGLRHRDGQWVRVCLFFASLPGDRPGTTFAVLGPAPPPLDGPDRVAELESRLRRIAAEVRAAGVLDVVDRMPSATDFRELADLTTRQWEVLERLLRGDRVPAIADALFISQITVRNHLAAIFRRFGVHSQDALIRLLRPADGEAG